MATVGSRDVGGGGSEPGAAAGVRSKAVRIGKAIAAARLASMLRRVPVPAAPVTDQITPAKVVLQRDFANVVTSPTSGWSQVEFTLGVDGILRAYSQPGGSGSLPGGNKGDILYFDGSDWLGLAVGAAGDVLTSDGTIPMWDAAPGGGGDQALSWAV